MVKRHILVVYRAKKCMEKKYIFTKLVNNFYLFEKCLELP